MSSNTVSPSNLNIFASTDASITQTSAAFQIKEVTGWSAQFHFTGTPNGTLIAEVSADHGTFAPNDNESPAIWSLLEDSTTAITGAGNPGYNVRGEYYNWVRFTYTAVSGTGTVSGRMNTKGV